MDCPPTGSLSAALLHGRVEGIHADHRRPELLGADFMGLVESMRNGWERKKRCADSVSSPEIDEIYDVARLAGAEAGKVSGAGVPPNRRADVCHALKCFGGVTSSCHFTERGTHAWEVSTLDEGVVQPVRSMAWRSVELGA
jgi:galactokinase/mevalonate kinase-like predicted kinase